MKLWVTIVISIMGLVFFTGCNNPLTQNKKLERQRYYQSKLIQKQQRQIQELSTELESFKNDKPIKKIRVKKVQDTNFNPEYMYPDTKKTKKQESSKAEVPNTASTQTTATIGKEECINIIGQAKFDEYTHLLGSEAASIKRCKILKAIKK